MTSKVTRRRFGNRGREMPRPRAGRQTRGCRSGPAGGVGYVIGGSPSGFSPVNIEYPAIRVEAEAERRLLAHSTMEMRGWNVDSFQDFLTRMRGVVENLIEAVGHVPELTFMIGNPPVHVFDAREAIFTDTLEGKFILLPHIIMSNLHMLQEIENLLCYHLALWMLAYDRQVQGQTLNPQSFVRGITGNRYLTGLKLESCSELEAIAAQIHQAGDTLEQLLAFMVGVHESNIATDMVACKVTDLLHPNMQRDYSIERVEQAEEQRLRGIVDNLEAGAALGPDRINIYLAYNAAIVHGRGYHDVLARIEGGLSDEIIPILAHNRDTN